MERIGFSLAFDAASQKLQAQFKPEEGAQVPDRAALDAELAVKGWSGFYLDEAAISAFLEQARQLAETPGAKPLELVIGERRDGSFKLDIAADKMSVSLTLVAPQGGRSVVDEVRPALHIKGIIHGIQEATLNEALAAGHCEDVVVALGTPPQEGEAAHFDSLIEALREAQFEAGEDEVVDYRDLGNLLIIHAGTPLMRRTPAVPGIAGTDVFGKTVPAQPVPDTPFSSALKGAAPAEGDSNQLVALIDGQPVPCANGVDVNPLIEVEQIDIESGNIQFDGTVQVKGDVKAGMHIRASGDVVIGGTLEAAEVVAGGNVVVKGGIVGRAEAQGATHGGAGETAIVRSERSVQAKFIEHGLVEARQDILVERAVRQSELSAGHDVNVGQSGSGQIMGGHLRAGLNVRTGVLGSPSGAPTHVQVGFDPYVNRDKLGQEALRKKKLEDYAKLRQLLDFLDKNPAKGAGGVREKAEMTAKAIQDEVRDLDVLLHKLSEQLALNEHAQVQISKRVHAGALIQIGQKRWEALDDGPGGSWRLDDKGELLSDWVGR